MKITVEIPTALRRFTDGVQTIECSSATLPDLLGEIEQRFPAIVKHLRDDSGQVRRFVNIYVNEEDIRFLGGNEYKFQEGDRVLVVPSIAVERLPVFVSELSTERASAPVDDEDAARQTIAVLRIRSFGLTIRPA